MNKTVKNYLIELPLLGIGNIFCGTLLLVLLIRDNSISSLIYFPVTTLEIILAYWVIVYADPGGVVNVYIKARKRTPDEELIYNLVANNRNMLLIRIVTFLLFLVVSIPEIVINRPTSITIDLIILLLFLPLISVVMILTGVKYVSSWWNIKNIK